MDIIITISDDKKRVLESILGIDKIQGWLQHAINNKCRKRIDAYILELTDLNPKKMTEDNKLAKLAKITLPIREEIDQLL
jgi:hypothetical protein